MVACLAALLLLLLAHSPSSVSAAPLHVATSDPVSVSYAFTDFTSHDAMAEEFIKCKFAAFQYTVQLSNSVALGVSQGYGSNLVVALRQADILSNWDNNVIYPLAGIFRKGLFDDVVLDRNIAGVVQVLEGVNLLGQPTDPAQPNGGMAGSYAYAILYIMDQVG